MSDLYGQIKLASDLEAAALNTLHLWWPPYSKKIEIEAGLQAGSLQMPRSFITAERLDRENADQMPAVVVVSPGLSGRRPYRLGDGTYQVYFALAVGIFVSGRDRISTKNLLRWYCGIARSIMIQKPSLGGFVAASDWLDESYDDNFDFVDEQTIAAGQVIFEVLVDDIVNKYAGPQGDPMPAPTDPAMQPGQQWPTVEVVTTTVVPGDPNE